MLSKRLVAMALCLFLVLVLSAAPMRAQATNTGTLIGSVMDPSGAVLAGATVSITDLSTRASRTLKTNTEGRYIFVNVPPGTYDVTVALKGFRTAKFTQQEVSVGTQLTLDATLQLGAVAEVVEVRAGAGAELQTMNATVGATVSGPSLDSLPSITREAATFVQLQPGVTPEGSVAGAAYDQNTFQLDGGQNTNDMDGTMNLYTPSFSGDPTGGTVSSTFTGQGSHNIGQGGPTGVMPTPIDSIEEFKVGTVNQTADFNSSAGAQVSMSTRRGSDSWHGTAYDYYLDNNLNANSFANNAPATRAALPDFHYNRFGAASGGPILPKKILGGKTYFFGNYEGFRYPDAQTATRHVPGPGLEQGLVVSSLCTAACGMPTEMDTPTVFNLNPTATTYTGPTIPGSPLVSGAVYPSANIQRACGGVSCDPRNLGISTTMQALWALMPQASPSGLGQPCGGLCDGVNILGFTGNVSVPQRSDFAVARLDHEFSDKWHFFSSYRFYRLTRDTLDQTDLTLNPPAIVSTSNRPQAPWFFVTGLTTNFTSNFTNDFHYSYLRNWWLQGSSGAPPQLPGLGAALEPNGETNMGVLSPYNVDALSVRTRYWDGQDNMLRDDMTRLLGNHVLQWGGTYQHNYNQHSRTDNGNGINYYPVYQLATGPANPLYNGINMSGFIPTGLASSAVGKWDDDYADVLGMLALDQIVYTRTGPQLSLNPPLTPIEDRVHIPYYNVYFTDSWHVRPTLTLTYGLAWTLEMPPVEEDGKQVALVDQANQLVNTRDYLNTTKKLALQGQVFNPELGFALVGNAAGGLKHPYNPDYGSFGPRLAVAWNPKFVLGLMNSMFGNGKTVVRGGFSIIYGRLNGVDLVLVPLLGYGLIQTSQCFNPIMTGGCAGLGGTTPATAFRVGPTAGGWDGLVAPLAAGAPTLPQPAFPGINSAAGGGAALDPNFRPNRSFEFDFTIQRQIARNVTVEAGYIGRIIQNEYQQMNLNAVPYMFTLGGQSFAKAYAGLTMEYCGAAKGLAGGGCAADTAAVTPQLFFETALGGTKSAYCAGFTSCTAAVAANEGAAGTGNLATQAVWSLWSDLDTGPFLAADGGALTRPTLLSSTGQVPSGGSVVLNTSLGYGNYNALFLSGKTADWHGLTMQTNFTYGKALSTGAVPQAFGSTTTDDPFRISRGYGLSNWDRKFVYNSFLVYQPPSNKSQRGLAGLLLAGWTFSPIFVAGSGLPLYVSTSTASQAFGESSAVNSFSNEQAVLLPGPGCSNFSTSRHNGVPGTAGVGTTGPYNINLFTDPATVLNCFRNPVLGFDNGHNGNAGSILRGQTYWNVDFQVRKTTPITERVSGEFQVIFTNLLNKVQLADPYMALSDPTDWGALEGQLNNPRSMEFGFRIRF